MENKTRILESFRIGRFLRTLWVAYREFRLQILFITILSFFNGIFEGVGIVAIIPLLSFVDGGATSGTPDIISNSMHQFFSFTGLDFNLRNLLVMLTLLFVVKALLMYWNVTMGTRIGYLYDTTTRERLYKMTLGAKWPFVSNQKLGFLEQVIGADVNYSSTILSSLSSTTIISVNLIIYSLIVVNLSLTVAIFTVIFGTILFILIKPIMYRNKAIADETAKMFKGLAHAINESTVGMKVIRSLSAEGPVAVRINSLFIRMGELKSKNLVYRNVSNIILPPLGFVFVLLMFAYMFKVGQFSIATFAVVVYAINKVFANIQLLQSQLHAMTSMLPHLSAVIQYEKEVSRNAENIGGEQEFKFEDKICLDQVSFSYPNRPVLLNKLSLEIKRGTIVGIAGSSGSGKTTVVDLLLRLLQPESGRIIVDNNPIESIKLASWRGSIGYVSQEPFLLNASILDNIRFFNQSIKEDDVKNFAKEAGIGEFIESLPMGYQTMVGERGVLLSGGQRQRIALARVLSRKPKLLILDEATSSLDAESEATIQSAIEKIRGMITVIIIAHRPGTLLLADKIVVLDQGHITEEGSPRDLLSDKDSYLSRVVNLASLN